MQNVLCNTILCMILYTNSPQFMTLIQPGITVINSARTGHLYDLILQHFSPAIIYAAVVKETLQSLIKCCDC